MRLARCFAPLSLLCGVLLPGCLPYTKIGSIDTRVVDDSTGEPIPEPRVLQLVHDLHDFDWNVARIRESRGSLAGVIVLAGESGITPCLPAPELMPNPDHFIVVWAPGYSPAMFSQFYGADELQRLKPAPDSEVAARLCAIPWDTHPHILKEVEPLVDGATLRLRKCTNCGPGNWELCSGRQPRKPLCE